MRKAVALALALILFLPPVAAVDLLQAYDMALENDPQLRAAKSTRDSTAEARPQAIAKMLPQVSARGTLSHTERETPAATFSYDSSELTATLTQPLLHFEHWMNLGKARYSTAKADADYSAAKLSLILRVAQAYFNILSSQDSLKFAEAERKAISRQLDQAKQRFDVGLIAITDVHEAQAAFDQARANEITANNDVDSAWEALREIVADLPENRLNRLREALPLSKPNPADIGQWTDTAMEQNYSIIAAMNNAKAARKNIAVKSSGHLPTLDAVGSHSRTTTDYSAATDANVSTLSLQLQVPIFAGGEVLSQTRQARYDYQTASEQLEQARRAVRRKVSDAYRGVVSSISKVEAYKAATVSAQSALDATQAGFEVGTRTIVDVLDAQRNLYRARRDYARARYDYIVNGLALKEAAGILDPEDLRMVNALLTK
ncbi:MAG: TolC family outer membrane protein [Gammaproteobacteria bacterium]|nr:TolC family outer membrane protein [Gammaproteobacteria bacterium]MBU1653349.1 TolC family outer membrane protein [Gammaproteobacteria bacterium]MBU1962777.1 TolC family outer membrane protein [Gammaproteobacteria bacterium]